MGKGFGFKCGFCLRGLVIFNEGCNGLSLDFNYNLRFAMNGPWPLLSIYNYFKRNLRQLLGCDVVILVI